MQNLYSKTIMSILTLLVFSTIGLAQTTAFNFQGRLNDGTSPANGIYDLQFKLFDAITGGAQIGATVEKPNTMLVNGVFSTPLDFGAAAFSSGNRFIEISVRPNGSPNAHIILGARQQILSVPFAVSANALSANCVNCVTSGQIQSLNGAQITGTIPTASVPSGSDNYIQNAALGRERGGQPAASFDVGSGRVSGNLTVAGQVGVGTETPLAGYKLDVSGFTALRPSGEGPGGRIFFGTPNGETGMTITGTNRADLRFNDSVFSFTAGTGLGVPANRGVVVNTSGEVGIATLPTTGLKLDVGGVGRFFTPNGNITLGTPNTETGLTITRSNRADIRFNDSILTIAAGIGTGVPGNFGVTVNTAGNVGIGTANPTTRLDVAGTVKTSILEITSGSDLAEKFEFSEEVKPGLVVAIDPRNAGKLTIARGAYNRQVAGIISGANNLSAGMTLPDVRNSANGIPVALSGRVWVYADASRNPIRAGDLLTTSSTPGYAMKVTNYKKANGAIIGKAMSELKSGTGLLLVLVGLQ